MRRRQAPLLLCLVTVVMVLTMVVAVPTEAGRASSSTIPMTRHLQARNEPIQPWYRRVHEWLGRQKETWLPQMGRLLGQEMDPAVIEQSRRGTEARSFERFVEVVIPELQKAFKECLERNVSCSCFSVSVLISRHWERGWGC